MKSKQKNFERKESKSPVRFKIPVQKQVQTSTLTDKFNSSNAYDPIKKTNTNIYNKTAYCTNSAMKKVKSVIAFKQSNPPSIQINKNARCMNFYSYAKSKNLMKLEEETKAPSSTHQPTVTKDIDQKDINLKIDDLKMDNEMNFNGVKKTESHNVSKIGLPKDNNVDHPFERVKRRLHDKRTNFQYIIGNLDKQLKKSQLSFVNNRHFSLPQ